MGDHVISFSVTSRLSSMSQVSCGLSDRLHLLLPEYLHSYIVGQERVTDNVMMALCCVSCCR